MTLIKLAIIGASYLQLPLIEKAKKRGIETHVFAWAANDVGEWAADYFYPISIIEKEKILEVCRRIGIKGICSIASDIAMITVNYVANELGLIGNSMDCVSVSTNKCNMRKCFEINGDPSVRYKVVGEADMLNKEDAIGFPMIVKPVDRSGSRGVTKIESPTELGKAILYAQGQSFKKEAIVEEYIEGDEYSIETISWEGKHEILSITQKWTTGAPQFIEVAHLEPALLDDPVRDELELIVKHALNSLQIENGASHTEVKINKNGEIKIIEIGGRMGGDCIGSDLVYLSTGYDFVNAVIDIALGIHPPKYKPISGASAIKFIFTEKDIQLVEQIKNEHPEYVIREDIQKLDGRTITDSSNRYGYILLAAHNTEDLIRYL